MNDNLLTKLSLSLYFQVSERTIERWEKLGMPVVIIGKVHRYDLAKVEQWADTQGKVKN
jgi:phage terminase Nu1 subunit (DNA packaging protein)